MLKRLITVPRLELQASHQLDYRADGQAGIGGSHLILLGCEYTDTLRLLSCENPHTLHLLQLQGNGYKQLWQKACPQGVHYFDRKYVADDDSLITRHWGDDPTWCWSQDLTLLHTHAVGADRKLKAVLPPHTLVCREEMDGRRQLVLFEGNRRSLTLKPPMGTLWSDHLSMCQHTESGFVAVTDHDSLYVFDSSGVQHVRLEYCSGIKDAITSTASHLVVSEAGTTVLHFHTWNGEEVQRVNVREVAGLEKKENTVFCVRVCQGNILHVAVGEFGFPHTVTSLHAFTLH